MKKKKVSEEEIKRVEDIVSKIDEKKKKGGAFSPNPPILPCCVAITTNPKVSTARFGELPINAVDANRRDPVSDPKSYREYGYCFSPHHFEGEELKELLRETEEISKHRHPREIGGSVNQKKLFVIGKKTSSSVNTYLVDNPMFITCHLGPLGEAFDS